MAYLNEFIRVTFGGTLAGDNEIWSCNFHLVQRGGIRPVLEWWSDSTDKIADLGDLLEGYVSSPETLVPNGVALKWVKMALIGTNGEYLTEAVDMPLNAYGSITNSYLPQASIVNSLVSSKWKDPGRYNRFYLPTASLSGSGQYQLSSGETNAYVGRLKTFIEAVNTTMSDLIAVEYTLVGVVSGTREGSDLPVSDVRIGRVVDTQRRRRNSLSEAYSTAEIDLP